jgi:multisubunit Na+/H+ antiporter MnhB subunit
MKRLGIGLLCAIGGFVVVAVASYFLVLEFSSNRHDRELEAAMTSVFVYGPAGALLAFIAGMIASGRSADKPRAGE